jgi:hypothetical protein
MRRILGLAAVGLAALAAGVANGSAAVNGCSGQTYTQPFLPWLDPASYVLDPGATFEDALPGWTLAGGAKVVAGNESYSVNAKGDSHSLSLPPGSSATSAPICVTLAHPTVRFFARNTGSALSALSALSVSVRFPTVLGTATLPIGVVAGGSAWQPTLPILILLNATALVSPNGTIPVQFTFAPLLSGGAWQVDDVYVDPYKSG